MPGYTKKQIEKILRDKLKEWASTIEDEKILASGIQNESIISGGAITSLLLGEDVNDFDIYFNNLDLAVWVTNYYVEQFCNMNNINKDEIVVTKKSLPYRGRIISDIGSVIISLKEPEPEKVNWYDLSLVKQGPILKKGNALFYGNVIKSDGTFYKNIPLLYQPRIFTQNAITLDDKIQIILRHVGPINYIHDNFDFIHCTNFFSERTGLVLNPLALESTLSKSLVYNNSKFPIDAFLRINKFVKKGWSISQKETLKIAYDISAMQMSDPDILTFQLEGNCHNSGLIIEAIKDETEIDRTAFHNLLEKHLDY